jgi:hypothetical protein
MRAPPPSPWCRQSAHARARRRMSGVSWTLTPRTPATTMIALPAPATPSSSPPSSSAPWGRHARSPVWIIRARALRALLLRRRLGLRRRRLCRVVVRPRRLPCHLGALLRRRRACHLRRRLRSLILGACWERSSPARACARCRRRIRAGRRLRGGCWGRGLCWYSCLPCDRLKFALLQGRRRIYSSRCMLHECLKAVEGLLDEVWFSCIS